MKLIVFVAVRQQVSIITNPQISEGPIALQGLKELLLGFHPDIIAAEIEAVERSVDLQRLRQLQSPCTADIVGSQSQGGERGVGGGQGCRQLGGSRRSDLVAG